MPRKSTPSFIAEIPLFVTMRDEREMLVRLELARQLKNACLGEALHRLDRMRHSVAWLRARSAKEAARQEAFKTVRAQYGFTSASISAFATQCKNEAKWNTTAAGIRLGAHETQRIAEGVFASAEQCMYGVRGRPRFRGQARPVRSIEGKSDGSLIRWNRGAGVVQWGNLALLPRLPAEGRDPWLDAALKCRTKYVRVVWRMVKGQRRWFAQLVQEGMAPVKHLRPEGIVGLDVGPSTVAVCSTSAVSLEPLAPEVVQPWKKVRRIHRAMDRSRRATNPGCFNADGTWKRGARIDVRSNHYTQLRASLAETERVLAERRKRSHGRLSNQILALGTTVRTETLSYRAFQKCYGRSVKVRGVATLMSLIRRKAESAGGALQELNTWSLKLSQYDHATDTCTKKALSQRWHVLGDGSGIVQRDCYSAFLASTITVGADQPLQSDVAEAWPVAQTLLQCAGWMRIQPTSAVGFPAATPKPSLPAPVRIGNAQTSESVAHQRLLESLQHLDARPVEECSPYRVRTPWL